MNIGRPRRAVFLDRDGTINVEKNYLYRREEFEFLPRVPEAIRQLNLAGLCVVVVTNQSGVARGYYSLEDVARLHRYVDQQLEAFSAKIDAYYVCPHHPTAGEGQYTCDCDCRKGKPGLLKKAAIELGLDLQDSYMVGDKPSDLDAAIAAGVKPILVRTGYGSSVREGAVPEGALIEETLYDAVQHIVHATTVK